MNDSVVKRRVWRIHLSSALLMTLAAGALVGMNIRQQPSAEIHTRLSGGRNPWQIASENLYTIGWPTPCLEIHKQGGSLWDELKLRYHVEQWRLGYAKILPPLDDVETDISARGTAIFVPPPSPKPSTFQYGWLWVRALTPLGIDVLVGFAAMLLVAIPNEWRIRRKHA